MQHAIAPLSVIALASDHAGFALKAELASWLGGMGYEVRDLGTDQAETSVDYPDYGNKLADAMAQGEAEFGIAICGSGIGISIALNRHRHIRAALCQSGLEARLAREHNDANVLALGARMIGIAQAQDCVEQFVRTAFAQGRHSQRVEKLA